MYLVFKNILKDLLFITVWKSNKRDDRTPHNDSFKIIILRALFRRSSYCSLQVSSQHPYAEQYIGKPHVMTVDYNNSLEFDSAIREIMRTKVLLVRC